MSNDLLRFGYCLKLRPTGAWATPWHADTIWGSLCWAYREAYEEKELLEWLERFRTGNPPFVLSDALPGELLPFPIGAPDERPEGQKGKVLYCQGHDLSRPVPAPADKQRPFATHGMLHAQLSRNTDATDGDEGRLFEMDQFAFSPGAFPSEGERRLTVYFRSEAEALGPLRMCWEILSLRGYGRRSSAGLGSFEISDEPVRCEWLDIEPQHNGFVSLSHFVPKRDDPRDGFWRLHVKNPKFAVDRVPKAFKGNLLLLTPGSRFRTEGPPKAFYGRMLKMPREGFEKALHYGLCMPAPVRWEEVKSC